MGTTTTAKHPDARIATLVDMVSDYSYNPAAEIERLAGNAFKEGYLNQNNINKSFSIKD